MNPLRRRNSPPKRLGGLWTSGKIILLLVFFLILIILVIVIFLLHTILISPMKNSFIKNMSPVGFELMTLSSEVKDSVSELLRH